ncbi:hypothetical protein CCACVL1_02756 [Corchorus capsularis]|uniref:Uncharacterized protein n=1 Tax=Corchorus capsularis TaxID=210143 RepID=A0A1R3H8I6_COCAP|nr:hypothetical protein CCACVL1_21077 [Corchorus capsularis]OMP02567.1 hypothetical protein CCACVL1_02756 [Corchorus capsularis]
MAGFAWDLDFKKIGSEPTLRRSRREVKKTPLWGLWKDEEDQTPMEDSKKGIDSDNLYLLADICVGFHKRTPTRPRSRLETKKNPLWGSKRKSGKILMFSSVAGQWHLQICKVNLS